MKGEMRILLSLIYERLDRKMEQEKNPAVKAGIDLAIKEIARIEEQHSY